MAAATRGKKLKQAKQKVQRYEETLRIVLTPAEIAERADRAAQLIAKRDSMEEDMKAAQKHAKSEIEKVDAEIRFLSNEVRTKARYGKVECERVFDYESVKVIETRLDTGELLNDRKMTEAESQRELFEDSENGDQADTDKAEGA